MGAHYLTNKTSCSILLSKIISTKEFHLSVKLKRSKVTIFKNEIYSKEKIFLKKKVLSFGPNQTVEIWPNNSAKPNVRSVTTDCQPLKNIKRNFVNKIRRFNIGENMWWTRTLKCDFLGDGWHSLLKTQLRINKTCKWIILK